MTFPNTEQKKVIEHRGKPIVVVAGPGTGKTRTLVTRMVELLKEDAKRKISFITFTRMSRKDTQRKIEEAIGTSVIENREDGFPTTTTLHSYAKALVHKQAAKINRRSDFSVLISDKGEKGLLLKELINDLSINVDIQVLDKGLSCFHSTNNWPDNFSVSPSECLKILKHFNTLLLFYNTFDIESIVMSACKILEDFAGDLPPLYLQVDEYQDLNPTDQKFVQLVASHPDSQVVVAGDDAQSIYGFRHAYYKGIRELWDSTDWEKIRFQECPRLPGHIINAAQALIANEGYLGGKLSFCPDNGKKILTLQCTRPKLQLRTVAKQIAELKSTRLNKEGKPLTYNDFLVLCPTGKFISSAISTLQNKFGIPTKQAVKPSIPDDHWRLLLVLRMLHSKDSLALRQWLSISGLKDVEITCHRHAAMANNLSLYDYCATLDYPRISVIFDAIKRIMDARDDFNKFSRALREFPDLLIQQDLFSEVGLTIDEITQKPRSIGVVIQLIYEKFGLIDSESDVPEDDQVLVTTLHSAKGLEAEYVFVTWMNEKYMPMPQRDPSEEKRLLYVALTRARQEVIITFHESYDYKHRRFLKQEVMSPFLHEIKKYLNVERVTTEDVR